MDIINDDVIQAILPQLDEISSIRVLDWHIDGISEKTSNTFITQLSKLTIRYQPQPERNAPPKEKTFIIKDPTKAPLYKIFKAMRWYVNEVIMYSDILPKMYTIADDADEYFTPRQYYFNDDMSLVLEDLSQSGYKCCNWADQLDVEHCIYALRHLAKFHALSVKLELTAGLPESIKRNSLFSIENAVNIDALITQQIDVFVDSIPQNLKDRYPNMATSFKNLSSEALINLFNDSSVDTYNVLNHTDFNINNIMFEYNKYQTVRRVKFIDFQLTSWGSPAHDLTFFTITSMKFEVYLKYFPLLLKIYINTLNKILRTLDCPTYNTQRLLNDLDIAYPYALYVLSCTLPHIMFDPNEPVVCDFKSTGEIEKLEPNLRVKAYEQTLYRKISVKWFEHFAKNGTLRIDEENSTATESSIID